MVNTSPKSLSPKSRRRASKKVNAMLKRTLASRARKSRTQARVEKMLVAHMKEGSKLSSSGRRCIYGVKKSGACKTKPGRRKSGSSPKRVKVGALLSKRLERMIASKTRGSKLTASGKYCRYGVKKSGGCKVKPGGRKSAATSPKRVKVGALLSKRLERMIASKAKGSKLTASGKYCRYGVKKSGGCKAKPGVSKSKSPKRVKVGALLSKRLAKMIASKAKGSKLSASGKYCRYGVKKSGGCKAKPGQKK